ncbi:MAG: hypothetical protein MST05_00310 [Treponema sp.]|nr:hypothetical protein [Treponema sp.]
MKKNVMVLALSFLLALLFTSCETEVNTLYHWYTVESGSISESDYNKAVSSEVENPIHRHGKLLTIQMFV